MRSLAIRLVAVSVSAAALVIPASAAANVGTVVTVFHAFTATGQPMLPTRSVSGYCWTGSIAADRRDAWRCATGNALYDPCFSSKAAPGAVLCPNEQLTSDIKIRLTRPLPTKQADPGTASAHSQPWLIELAASSGAASGGVYCEFATGGSSVVGDVRLNYYCSGGAFSAMGLWGLPAREHPEWSIRMTPTTAKALAPHAIAKTLAHASDVGIRHVWT
ncbi:MAG: hypothetical protein ABSG64_06145 [Solirubrobacteraceae bacterium]